MTSPAALLASAFLAAAFPGCTGPGRAPTGPAPTGPVLAKAVLADVALGHRVQVERLPVGGVVVEAGGGGLRLGLGTDPQPGHACSAETWVSSASALL